VTIKILRESLCRSKSVDHFGIAAATLSNRNFAQKQLHFCELPLLLKTRAYKIDEVNQDKIQEGKTILLT
jgi:hypothetical protein